MHSKEELTEIAWKSFCNQIDKKMPQRAGHCPFCFGGLHATFDNYGEMFFFCDCIDWVMFVEEFRLNNPNAFEGDRDE